jgi:hypothetical protein
LIGKLKHDSPGEPRIRGRDSFTSSLTRSPCRTFVLSRQIVLPQVHLRSSCFDSTSPVIAASKSRPHNLQSTCREAEPYCITRQWRHEPWSSSSAIPGQAAVAAIKQDRPSQ